MKYMQNLDKKRYESIDKIFSKMTSCRINCVKYNNTLDSDDSPGCLEAYLNLSKDHKKVIITNKVPKKYGDLVLASDPI